MKISPAQQKVFDFFKKAYAHALSGIEAERQRWGDDSANALEHGLKTKGIQVFIGAPAYGSVSSNSVTAPVSTWVALERAGYLKLVPVSQQGSELRKGAWGRWLGGTKPTYSRNFYALPLK